MYKLHKCRIYGDFQFVDSKVLSQFTHRVTRTRSSLQEHQITAHTSQKVLTHVGLVLHIKYHVNNETRAE